MSKLWLDGLNERIKNIILKEPATLLFYHTEDASSRFLWNSGNLNYQTPQLLTLLTFLIPS